MIHSRCDRWLWARRLDGETTAPDFVEIDFAVQATGASMRVSPSADGLVPTVTRWIAVATWRGAHPADGGQRAAHVDRVSDAPRATPELAAEDLRIAVEGTQWRKPWSPVVA